MHTPHSIFPATHEVTNQPPPLEDINLYARNVPLQEAVVRDGAAWASDYLVERGAELGAAAMLALGEAANRNPPLLRLFDRQGHRRDEVDFHPAWHQLLAYLTAHGLHAGPWEDAAPAGAHVARAAHYMLHAEVENGSQCPVTMTYGAVPAIRRQAEVAADWLPLLLSRRYDPRAVPARDKHGVLVGMGMTEKQGGSDVRANTSRAVPEGPSGPGQAYRLTGHKWFFSAPMCDAHLVLAQAPGGLSCFFLPRFTPDGELNAVRIQRLKDKLGDRSNAGAEVEFAGAWARLLGEEGRGVPTILEMGTYTRLDCAIGAAGQMRQALSQALHHCAHRRAFGKLLRNQPLMQNVLADMALESEAATALALRLARSFDREAEDDREALLRRLLTPAAKYWLCKRAPMLAAEAMEVLGGNGYVEDWPLARLYRQAPLNSIWEGAGNVMCLDVLRALARHPATIDALAAELEPARATSGVLNRYCGWLLDELREADYSESSARRLTQDLALAVQAALLTRHAPQAVADAFIATRLAGDWGYAFGTLPKGSGFDEIVLRAWPRE
ncbi:MAG: isovaleryl-CoA dehydrogenase [Betaproteobacteria bacterium]|nr:isovaleryl-CoA dehydrogenase [Betaproteobacteria bacterium]